MILYSDFHLQALPYLYFQWAIVVLVELYNLPPARELSVSLRICKITSSRPITPKILLSSSIFDNCSSKP